MTAHDPLSTFAADVDTASYDIFRRDVNLGPAAAAGQRSAGGIRQQLRPTRIRPRPRPMPIRSGSRWPPRATCSTGRPRCCGWESPRAIRVPFEKRPANLVFLVDVSGSMAAADKLPLVQAGAARHPRRSSSPDRHGLDRHLLGDTPVVRLAPTPRRDKRADPGGHRRPDRQRQHRGRGGLTLAYEQARRGFIDGGINHILLCTDGDFNVGPSSTEELLALVKQQRADRHHPDRARLRHRQPERPDDGGGQRRRQRHLRRDQQRARRPTGTSAERMLSTLVHVAKNMKIQVEFNPARVVAYRLLGYEDRAVADSDFRNDTVDGGEVGAGHRVTALYELVLTGTGACPTFGRRAAGRRRARRRTAVPGGRRRRTRPGQGAVPGRSARRRTRRRWRCGVGLPAAAARGADLGAADADLRWATAVAAFAEILKKSPYADRDVRCRSSRRSSRSRPCSTPIGRIRASCSRARRRCCPSRPDGSAAAFLPRRHR